MALSSTRWFRWRLPQVRQACPLPKTCTRTALALLASVVSIFALTWSAPAQQMDLEVGRAISGTAMPSMNAPLGTPVASTDIELHARRATAWQNGSGRMLLLEGDVVFKMGLYGFRARRAVVRIDEEKMVGRTVRHVAIYMSDAHQLGGSGSAIAAEASRLLVTGSTSGGIALETDLLQRATSQPDDSLVRQGLDRISRYYQTLSQATFDIEIPELFTSDIQEERLARRQAIEHTYERFQAPEPAHETLAEEMGIKERVRTAQRDLARRIESDPGDPEAPQQIVSDVTDQPDRSRMDLPDLSLLPTQGVLYLSQDRMVVDTQGDQNTVMLIGNVRALYRDYESDRTMTLKAEKMVLFVRAGSEDAVQGVEVPANAITGVYLEDNAIISDGQYTVRAPRMFYDLESNRAILLEAVFFTWDPRMNIPLYVRAETLRQTSQTTFEAEKALITTSEFGEPHFAIGLDRVYIEQKPASPQGGLGGGGITGMVPGGEVGDSQYYIEGRNATLRVQDTPLFWLPGFAGTSDALPIDSIQTSYSSKRGFNLETGWRIFPALGMEEPEGVDLVGNLDYRGDHGFATGLFLDYDRPDMFGSLQSYLLPYDKGTDYLPGRRNVDHDGDVRGFAQWQHRQQLANDLELSLEFAYVSDPTFLDEFFPEQVDATKPYETSIFLKKQEDDWAFTLLAKYNLNDFAPQLTTLQTPGYQTDKLPELGYYRVGTSLFEDRLTYFTESRYSLVRARFGNETPRDRGFTNRFSQMLFGIPNNVSFKDAAEARNFPMGWVNRFDTRHELNMPLKVGMFNITPYATGRITAYDQGFEDWNGQTNDSVRFWGGVGTRIHTSFTNTYDIDSRLLDLHRLRHTIEPSVNFFLMGTTLNAENLPVYDYDIEAINAGRGVRFGMLQTFQTQRGGPGRYRNVDWLTIQTDVVLMQNENNPNAPIARFYDYRPEYSTGGDHFYSEVLWMVTDTVGFNAEVIYSLEGATAMSYWRVGTTFDLSPRLRFFLDYESIDPTNSKLMTYGFMYELTRKYTLSYAHRLSLAGGDNVSRDITIALERKLPRWRLQFIATHDQIGNDTTIGVLLLPEGLMGNQAARGMGRAARSFMQD